MNSELFEKNLALLTKKDPLLAERVRSVRPAQKYVVSDAKKGPPFLSLNLPNGTRKTLLSSYDPLQEAVKFIDSCPVGDCLNFIVLGVGLGYHAVELLKRIPRSCQITLVEREMGLFYLALMHCDLSPVLKHPGISLHVERELPALLESLQEKSISFVLNGLVRIAFKPLIGLELKYYDDLILRLDRLLAETKVDLRTKAAFSKIFYQNIIGNWKNYLESPGIYSLENYYSGFPVVIVSAGPSLDKNIQYLKHAADQFVVIAVGTALKPLLKLGIEPDFVVALDSDDITLGSFQMDLVPENTWLIFDPSIPPAIAELFPEKRIVIDSGIYLSEWMAEYHEKKGNWGKTFSVAHTAFLIARFLGCEPIVFAGQDLAFSGKRLHCNHTFYDQERRDKIGFIKTLRVLETERYLQFAQSFRPAIDIFGYPLTTTVALELYKTRFADEFIQTASVYNATEGGVPVPGGKNVCLQEALHRCGEAPIHSKRANISSHLSLPKPPKNILRVLKDQASRLRSIRRDLEKIRLLINNSSNGKSYMKKEFVRVMESYYQSLMQEPETLKLMQGYMYSGFIEWNRQNGKISLKEKDSSEEEIIDEKFQRDETLLGVLEEAAQYLATAFEKMAQEKKAL